MEDGKWKMENGEEDRRQYSILDLNSSVGAA